MAMLVTEVLLDLAASHLVPVLLSAAGSMAVRCAGGSAGVAAPASGWRDRARSGDDQRGNPQYPGYRSQRDGDAPWSAGLVDHDGRAGCDRALPRRALSLVLATDVLSATPGRVRLHVAGLRGDRVRADWVEQALGRLPGVRQARANCTTGSTLVLFDPTRTSVARLRAALEPPRAPALWGGRAAGPCSRARAVPIQPRVPMLPGGALTRR